MTSHGTAQDITVKDPRSITDLGDFMDSFVGSTRSLISAERSYITFMATKRTAEAVRKVAGSLAAFVFYGLAVLIASLGWAIWLSDRLGSALLGFVCVAGCYVLVGLVFGALWKGAMGKRFIVGLINSFHGH
jgi:hypothetical protein